MGATKTHREQRAGGWWPIVAAALALGTIAGKVVDGGESDRLPGYDAPTRIDIAPAGEPGRRLIVRGQVFAPDGETPVEGVVLYVYNTGADGRYAPAGERVPRLRGWVRTGPGGRYEVRTIRPGPYPGRRTAAHVHVFLWGAGHEPQWTEELLFADDPRVAREERRRSQANGRFAHVCDPDEESDGALSCVFDIRLKPRGDDFPEEVSHAFEAPGKR